MIPPQTMQQLLQTPLAGFKGPTSKGRVGEGRKGGREGKGKAGERRRREGPSLALVW